MARKHFLAVVLLGASASALPAQSVLDTHRRACEGGEVNSCTVLGLIYETGAGGVRDVNRAIDLYQRACDFGLSAACTRLALAQRAGADAANADGFSRAGYVADAETGEPVIEAVVDVPELGIRALADESGRIELGRLPRGEHRVTARRFGYDVVEGALPVPWNTEFLMLLQRSTVAEEAGFGRIFGRVTEEGTGRGLPYVDVVLRGTPVRTISDAEGRFALARLEPGRADISFSLLGYAERATEVVIAAGGTIEVYATLAAQPIELEPIEVAIGSSYLERSGFYRRALLAGGSTFTRMDLDVIDPVVVSDVLWRAPGVTVTQMRWGTRAMGTRPASLAAPGPCRLRPYLDGVSMFEWDLDLVRPDDLEAIEIYQGASAPIEYRNLVDPDGEYPCGVILIWTRRGR